MKPITVRDSVFERFIKPAGKVDSYVTRLALGVGALSVEPFVDYYSNRNLDDQSRSYSAVKTCAKIIIGTATGVAARFLGQKQGARFFAELMNGKLKNLPEVTKLQSDLGAIRKSIKKHLFLGENLPEEVLGKIKTVFAQGKDTSLLEKVAEAKKNLSQNDGLRKSVADFRDKIETFPVAGTPHPEDVVFARNSIEEHIFFGNALSKEASDKIKTVFGDAGTKKLLEEAGKVKDDLAKDDSVHKTVFGIISRTETDFQLKPELVTSVRKKLPFFKKQSEKIVRDVINNPDGMVETLSKGFGDFIGVMSAALFTIAFDVPLINLSLNYIMEKLFPDYTAKHQKTAGQQKTEKAGIHG